MKKTRLGQNGPEVSALGFGCMGLVSDFFGEVDTAEARRTLLAGLESGLTLLDTSDTYGLGKVEEMVGGVLKEWHREDVFLCSKFGIIRKQGALERTISGKPEYVKQAAEASLKRLGCETIDLYYIHRIDSSTPIEETIGAMADLVKEGKVRYLGISEASAETIRRAHRVHPLTAVQSEYSLFARTVEKEILPVCRELGIGFVAYSPLSRGLLTGKLRPAEQIGEGDVRKVLPRHQGENYQHNMKIVEQIHELAKQKGATAPQLAMAWLIAQGTLPIPGMINRSQLAENIKCVDIELNAGDMQNIEAILAQGVRGERLTNTLMFGIEDY